MTTKLENSINLAIGMTQNQGLVAADAHYGYLKEAVVGTKYENDGVFVVR
jgi:hypothetical protein